MPRQSRIVVPGEAVHIVQRGNNRVECFHCPEDRSHYLFHLARLLRVEGCALHAWCLMSNHVHLLLTPEHEESCARLMKRLGQLHAQYMNRVYGRTGTLWEGRFRSCLVDSQDYAVACYRYIELNPVRAGLVEHPREYAWSSYRANAESIRDPMLTPHRAYLALGAAPEERGANYVALFGSHASPPPVEEIRAATQGGFVLGSTAFRRRIARALGRRVEPGSPGRPARAAPDAFSQDLLRATGAENVV